MFGVCPCGWSVDSWGRAGFREVAKGFLNIFYFEYSRLPPGNLL